MLNPLRALRRRVGDGYRTCDLCLVVPLDPHERCPYCGHLSAWQYLRRLYAQDLDLWVMDLKWKYRNDVRDDPFVETGEETPE